MNGQRNGNSVPKSLARQIGAAVGVDQKTVRKDLRSAGKSAPDGRKAKKGQKKKAPTADRSAVPLDTVTALATTNEMRAVAEKQDAKEQAGDTFGKRVLRGGAVTMRVGEVFGRLTVVAEAPPRHEPGGRRARLVWVRCTCGTELLVRAANLRSGTSRSCGCLARALASTRMSAWRRAQHAPVVAASTNRIRAERRVGELLREQAEKGERRPRGVSQVHKNDHVVGGDMMAPPTVAEQGLTRDESSTYQKLADTSTA